MLCKVQPAICHNTTYRSTFDPRLKKCLSAAQVLFTAEHLQEVHNQSPIAKSDLQVVGDILLHTPVPPQPANFLSQNGLSWPAVCANVLL